MKTLRQLALYVPFGLTGTLLPAGPAFCSDLSFTLDNNTNQDITAVYLSQHAASSWGAALPNSATKAGTSNDIGFDDGKASTTGDDCNYDIKLRLQGGNGQAVLYSIDLCAAMEIALGTKTANGNTFDTFTVTYTAYGK
ncbi:hypothetical protein [Acidocella sp.]|uniref:hypothetical protein n=1 Tax=Acidocella sp. TaxID=50710 RepID=UPI0026168DB8|nr:hypothetical protein [Acidocella sp.]